MPERLSLEQRMNLADDPRVRTDPQFRARVMAKLGPEDQQWLIDAMKDPNAPPDAEGGLKGVLSNAAGWVKDNPAAAGGMAGGLIAAPFTGGMSLLPALGLTALAGAGGAGYGMLTSAATGNDAPLPNTIPGVLAEEAKQGALQAGGEGFGRGIGALLQRGGTGLMNTSIAATDKLRAEFPNAAETLVSERINPTTMRGVRKATRLRNESAAQTRDLVSQSKAPGITRRELGSLTNAQKLADEEAAAGVTGADLERRANELFGAQPPLSVGGMGYPTNEPAIPVAQGQKVIRQLQREGVSVRNAVNAGNQSSALPAVVADDLAGNVRQAMNERVPGFAESNARTQNLIGASKIARRTQRQPAVSMRQIGTTATGLGMGSAAGYATGDPLMGIAAGTIPIALGTPQISAPIAIALYQAGRLPYAELIKIVGPTVAAEATTK